MNPLINQPLTLLIIDDDDDDREMLAEEVSEFNSSAAIVMAANGKDGLQKLQNEEIFPDFIFVDLNMPRMNGKQFLVAIKSLPKFKNIPVIIYTTSKSVEDKEDTKKLGAVYFITKPSKSASLKKELTVVFTTNWQHVNA